MGRSKQKEVFLLILCFLIGFALRFYTFDQKSLWLDEIYTFGDSRDGLIAQLEFYKKNPTFLHPPLFFILTHQFYPFTQPERDLRIIPLIFGTLSIPMIYCLSRLFAHSIALPGAISLTFMTYHISLSQDGRSYSLLMFLGMTGLYFFMKHLHTSKKRYLLMVAFFFSTLFYTSYSSIPFIVLSQMLWFYRPNEEAKKPTLSAFLILNGLILIFCLPWILFVALNLGSQPIMDPLHIEDPGSFGAILYGVLHDWVPHTPLMIISGVLFILLPLSSKLRKNALVLLAVFIFPIGGVYLFCKLFRFTHFVTSRYFINFLPLFFITLYIALETIEVGFKRLRGFLRLKLLFTILFIASNLIILPLYYRSEKQDFRGLVNYLKVSLHSGDIVIVGIKTYIHGMLHYFGIPPPEGREYLLQYQKVSEQDIEYSIPLNYKGSKFIISYSKNYWIQYLGARNRIWLIVDKRTAKEIKMSFPLHLKGYFDGSFLNFNRFPTDVSMYLFLWDPSSPEEKGMDMPIE